MNLKYNTHISQQNKQSYAKEEAHAHWRVDCSDGYNPFGFPESVKAAWFDLTGGMLNEYPHSDLWRHSIVEYWKPYVALDPQGIALCEGSIDGIYAVNTLFCGANARVLGVAPQFSDYVSHARLLGYTYEAVVLEASRQYRFDVQKVLNALNNSFHLLYLDNPNNPTGQSIPLADMRRILVRAQECGVCVIADEAYGDYMPEQNSAALLLPQFDNLIVLRTFSKGWGLAGLRAGYLLAHPMLRRELDKIGNPYKVSEPARRLIAAAMREPGFLLQCRQSISASKARLRNAIGNHLRMAATEETCPICLLVHDDADADLQGLFARHGVKTVSGKDFDGLKANSVRLRLVAQADETPLLEAVAAIDKA